MTNTNEPKIHETLPAIQAVELLLDNGVDGRDALYALDWADECGEYVSARYTVLCAYTRYGRIKYEISIY